MTHRPCRSALHALVVLIAFAFCATPAIAGQPLVHAAASASINVGGEVATPLHLDAAALAKLPREHVTASAHGVTGTWEGVALSNILLAAGVPMGEKLRGRNLLLYVRIGAADGYHAVFALAELDPGFRDAQPILADRHDGKPLDAKEGPFRIIAVGEKRLARWVRQVTSIDVLRAPVDSGK